MIPRRAEMSASARWASSPSRSSGNSGADLDPERLEVAGAPLGVGDGAQPGQLGDLLGVRGRDLAPTGDDLGQPAELDDADRGLQVGHPVVVADLEVLLRRRQDAGVPGGRGDAHRVLAQAARARGPLGVRRGEHAALAGGDDLARVERPRGDVRARTDGPAAVGRAGAARGVLDHDDAARVA